MEAPIGQAEAALLERVFQSTHALLAYLDTDLRFIRVNDKYAAADGRKPDEYPGRGHFELYPNEENEVIFRRVLASGEPYLAFEKPFEYADHPERGATYWDWSLHPVFSEGAVVGLVLSLIDVTERVRARAEAGEAAEEFRTVFDSAGDAVVIHDLDGRIVEVNETACTRLGYSRVELLALRTADISAPEFESLIADRIRSVTDRGRATFETAHLTRDGRVLPVEVSARRISFRGRPAILSAARDIRERRAATRALEESEARYRTLADVSPVGIFRTDANGDCVYVNQRWCELAGLTEGQGLGRGWLAALHPDDREAVRRTWNETVMQGGPFQMEYRFLRPDGTVVWLLGQAAAERAPGGAVVGYVGAVVDITARREAERRLAEREDRLAEAQRIAHLGNWNWDIAGGSLAWSDEIYRLFGLTPQEFGATYEAFLGSVHPDDRSLLTTRVDEALAGGAPYSIDHRIVWPDGTVREVHERAEVTRDASGAPVAMVGTVQDVTEARASERSLRRLNAALRTLSRGNEVLVHAVDEGQLLRDMCRVIVEVGGYRFAWVGFVDAGAAGVVEPLAWHGADGEFLASARIAVTDDALGRGPTGTALRTGHRQIVADVLIDERYAPWRDLAVAHGYRSVMSIPLAVRRERGVLVIYAPAPGAFDEHAEQLLSELADDLAFGINHLHDTERLSRGMDRTIQVLASTLEIRDPYTAGHQRRVAALAGAIAARLQFDTDTARGIRLAGAVHDIGKISVPVEILTHPGALLPEEWALVRRHAQIGHDIIKPIELPWPVAEMILQHHERLDGSGYPAGLAGDAILPGARVLAVADVVEAIAHLRPYRAALGEAAALEEIRTGRGVRYDAAVVDACVALFELGDFVFEE